MATFADGVSFWSSSDATNQTTGSFTPAPNDLLLLFAVLTGCVEARPVVTTTPATLGFEFVKSVVFGPDLHTMYCWVATSLATSTSRTVTVNCSPTTATSFGLEVVRTAGMGKSGLAAIRQAGTGPNGAAAGTPEVVMPLTTIAGNAYWVACANLTNPNTVTAPSGFTNIQSTGSGQPAGGIFQARNGGLAQTTLTWGAASASVWAAMGIELDTNPYTADVAPPLIGGRGASR